MKEVSVMKKRDKIIVVSLKDKDARLFSFSQIPKTEEEHNELQEPKKRFHLEQVERSADGSMVIHLQPVCKKEQAERFNRIAERLEQHLDRKKLLLDVIRQLPSGDVKELEQRLSAEASVKPKYGCFDLMVGGKKGRPFQLNIRD